MHSQAVIVILVLVLALVLFRTFSEGMNAGQSKVHVVLTVQNNDMFKQAILLDNGEYKIKSYGKPAGGGKLNANQMALVDQLINDPYFVGMMSGNYGNANSNSGTTYYHITTKIKDLEGVIGMAPQPFVNAVTQIQAMLGM